MLDTAADIAIIFLALESLLLLVAALAFSVLMAKMSIRARQKVQGFIPTVQTQAGKLADVTETVSQKVAEPFIRLDARRTRVQAMGKHAVAPGSNPTYPASVPEE